MPSLTDIQRVLQHIPEKSLFLGSSRQEHAITFTRIISFKGLLDIIKELDAFRTEIDFLLSSPLYSTTSDELRVLNTNGAPEIYSASEFLENSILALKRLMPRLLPEEPSECVYIRFPDAESISVITADLTTVETAAMQIISHKDIAGCFKVLRWESGSLWIHILVGTAASVTVLAGAAWSAAVVAKKWMEVRMFLEHAKGLAIKNDSLLDLETAQKKMLDELVAAEAKALADKYYDTAAEPEIVERVRYTISTFSELIRRGGEISPALNAPEQVENLFPRYKSLPTIQSQIKQIADNTNG